LFLGCTSLSFWIMAAVSRGRDRSRSLPGILAFSAVYVVWGSTYLGIKFAIETIPPLLMTGARFVLAGGALYGALRLRGAAAPSARQWLDALGIAVLMLVFGQAGVAWSEQIVPSSLAALMVATVPMWVVLLDWLAPRGTRPSFRTIAGLVVGFLGIATLVGPAELIGVGGAVHPLGAAVLLFASLSWAIGSVLSRHTSNGTSVFLATGMRMLVAGAVLLGAGLASGEAADFAVAEVSLASLLALLYLAGFGSVIALSAYVWLLQNAPISKTATYAYVNPIIAVFLGWAIAGEPVTTRVLVAAVVIIGAVLLITSEPRGRSLRPARPRPTPVESPPKWATSPPAPGDRRCA